MRIPKTRSMRRTAILTVLAPVLIAGCASHAHKATTEPSDVRPRVKEATVVPHDPAPITETFGAVSTSVA